jgi:membrane protein YqaA with SNARE-associated domain
MRLAGHRHALALLGVVSFAESSIFPIPPDVLLIPMVLAARARAMLFALVCTVASVAGGLAGYAIGYFVFDAVGRPLVEFYGFSGQFAEFQSWYGDWGLWIVLAAGLTPLPYKVFTIASGVAGLDVVVFTLGSVVSRGIRFFLEAALLWKFGPPIRDFVERHLAKAVTAAFVMLVAGFVVLRYVG